MQKCEERLALEFLASVATLSCLDQKFAHGKWTSVCGGHSWKEQVGSKS